MGNYLHKEHAREKITRALEFFTRARERNQRFCKNRHFFATFFHFFGVITTTCIMVIETRFFFLNYNLIRTNSTRKFKNIRYLQASLSGSKVSRNQTKIKLLMSILVFSVPGICVFFRKIAKFWYFQCSVARRGWFQVPRFFFNFHSRG